MIKLTDKAIEKVNSAMAERNPHGGLFLRKGAFGDIEVVYYDHFIVNLNGLWTLNNQVQAVVSVLEEELGIYKEA